MDDRLAEKAPVPAGGRDTSHVQTLFTGVRDGMPFTVFSYQNRTRDSRIAFAVPLPFEMPAAQFGDYVVDGATLVRSTLTRKDPKAILRTLDESVGVARELAAAAGDPTGALAKRLADRFRPDTRTSRDAPPGVRTYRRAVIGAVVGFLVVTGGVLLVSVDWTITGGLVGTVGGLVLLTNLLTLLSVWRTRSGRPRAAARYGWEFRPSDPTLLERLGVRLRPESRPGATGILSGSVNGVSFLFFDYLYGTDSRETAYLVRLAQSMPRIAVNVRTRRIGTSASDEGRALLTDDVLRRLADCGVEHIRAEGDWLWTEHQGFLSPRPQAIERALDRLTRAAAVLVAAAPAASSHAPEV